MRLSSRIDRLEKEKSPPGIFRRRVIYEGRNGEAESAYTWAVPINGSKPMVKLWRNPGEDEADFLKRLDEACVESWGGLSTA